MQEYSQKLHGELLELISKMSETSSSDRASSMFLNNDSSNSFSMLPAEPKIFYGRDLELGDIVADLCRTSARIAILGAGGMGKTSLAKAILYHSDITAKYQHRFFVAGDSATTGTELAALVASYLGLKPSENQIKPVADHFSNGPTCLLVLDNLETAWEPLESRARVEEFLSLLTDVPHLALIITMRGAERPAKVRWTRPFIPALQPLSDEAARQTFNDITDSQYDAEEIDQLLSLTDNLPLAVDLIAHLVDYEGSESVLARWDIEKTSLLSDGFDKRSSLDASIQMSLSSPRMLSLPGASELLAVLSLLPDGLSESELSHSQLPIQQLWECRAMLLRTSLAYNDSNKRLKALVPIREYTRQYHPPSFRLVQSLQNYFHSLFLVLRQFAGSMSTTPTVNNLTPNVINIHSILMRTLDKENPAVEDAIKCAISFNHFSRDTGLGSRWPLMSRIRTLLPQPTNHRLEVQFLTEMFESPRLHLSIEDPHGWIEQGISHFQHLDDPGVEAAFYLAIAIYCTAHRAKMSQTSPGAFLDRALKMSKASGDTNIQSRVLTYVAMRQWRSGDTRAGQKSAQEARDLAMRSGNLYDEAKALRVEALCFLNFGNYKQMLERSHRARDRLRLCGMEGGGMDDIIRNNSAAAYTMKSEYVEAAAIHAQILRTTPEDLNPYKHAEELLSLASIGIAIGTDYATLHENITRATAIFRKHEYPIEVMHCDLIMADLRLREGDGVAAKTGFLHGLHLSRGVDEEGVIFCLDRLADGYRWASTTVDWDSNWIMVYLGQAQKSQNKLSLSKAIRCLGDMFCAQEDFDTAHNIYVVALEAFTEIDVHRERASCMLYLGDIAKQRGAPVEAADYWSDARPLFERSLQGEQVKQIDSRLYEMDQVLSTS
ncbi:hypothetical protein C8R43DRAFT_40275 [Mycena crocata]|nr:hypothetical protein C8R43DRAFT_40275 [Mycena crocata]